MYGVTAWTKQMKADYYTSKGVPADGPSMASFRTPPKPAEKVEVEKRPEHYDLFVMSVRDNKPTEEDATEGHYAAGAGHLANIAYRVKRTLKLAQSSGRFIDDDEANGLLTRNYRAPYVVPVIEGS